MATAPRGVLVFKAGRTNGDVNYPIQHADSEFMRQEMRRYHLYPETNIDSYPFHYPYASDKKGAVHKITGRASLDAFGYTFQYREVATDVEDRRDHGSDPAWNVLMDYRTGLVKITAFFKARNYNKTMPKRVIYMSEKLEEICASPTGGAIEAQGYWMPYEAAICLASQFCYKFRWALVPIFGPHFPSMCEPYRTTYSKWIVPWDIVSASEHRLRLAKEKELQEQAADLSRSPSDALPSADSEPVFNNHVVAIYKDRKRALRARCLGLTATSQPSPPATPRRSHKPQMPLTPESIADGDESSDAYTPVKKSMKRSGGRGAKRRAVEVDEEPATPSRPASKKTKINSRHAQPIADEPATRTPRKHAAASKKIRLAPVYEEAIEEEPEDEGPQPGFTFAEQRAAWQLLAMRYQTDVGVPNEA